MGPLDLFFKMGEKATGGDPEKQADFIYYMVWILFVAFFWMFSLNVYSVIFLKDINSITWVLVGFAVSTIQYFSLKGMYDMRRMRKQPIAADKSLGSVDDMMSTFKKDVKGRLK